MTERSLEDIAKALAMDLDIATDTNCANLYVNKECGELHLQWVVAKYWGQIVHNQILPAGRKLYEALVAGNHTVENRFDNGNNHYLYFIPTDGDKKVWVHFTQNSNFLYIITEDNSLTLNRERFDIRKIYKEHNAERNFYTDQELIGTINDAIQHADYLIECHDDQYKYSKRHSLDFYRKINWKIPSYDAHIYGDGRDGGYVLSYESDGNIDFQEVKDAWLYWGLLNQATDILTWALDWLQEEDG